MSPQLFLMSRLRECISPSLLFSQLLFSLLCSFSLAAHRQRVETMLSGWVDIGAGQLQRTIAWEWAIYGTGRLRRKRIAHMDTRECFNCARSMRGVLVRAHNVVCFINATKLSALRAAKRMFSTPLWFVYVFECEFELRAEGKQTKHDAHNAGFVSAFATMHWEMHLSVSAGKFRCFHFTKTAHQGNKPIYKDFLAGLENPRCYWKSLQAG
jgi:hypothetical protein